MTETYLDLLRSPREGTAAMIMLIVWALRTLLFPAMIAAIGVKLSMDLARKFDVLAHPSSRGSHDIPTPRLGGLGAAAGFFVTYYFMGKWEALAPLEPWRFVMLLGGAWALIGGALDDFLELPPRWKLLLQIAASGTVLTFGFAPKILDIPFVNIIEMPAIAGFIMAFLVTFFMMNIFNFMDGMDGLAASFGIITALTLAFFIGNHGVRRGFSLTVDNMFLAASAAITAGSLIGLLIYNHPRRHPKNKTFMGDCGSQFYGFILATIALQASSVPKADDRFPLVASLILFSPFIYDVVFTLIRRYRNGDKLTQAHRTHLYQRVMVAGWSHGETLRLHLVLYVIVAVLAYLYAASPENAVRQTLIIITTGAMLTAYTRLVFLIEQAAANQRARQDAQSRL